MRKNTVGAAGLPPLAGEMSEGQRGHKAISTTYNPSPSMGEGQGEGDTTTFANQRRSIAGQTVHCYKTTIMTSQKTKPNVCNVPNRTIFEGDNLDVMRGINDTCIDLIHLDPRLYSTR